jgi:hypothetical protein
MNCTEIMEMLIHYENLTNAQSFLVVQLPMNFHHDGA